ncbi:MAG TPA: hypothetical protein VIS94_07725 [Desulfomonilia bacterium]|jgi:outer membrane protein assembly factor BamD (BamD/ComL family)
MRRIVIVVIGLCFLFGCASMVQRGALTQAYENYDKGDYQTALVKLSRAEKYKDTTPETNAEILYLKALTLQKMGRDKEYIGELMYLSDKYGDTEYGYKAKQLLK